MKKIGLIILLLIISVFVFGCEKKEDYSNELAIRLSSISDVSNDNKEMVYYVKAPYTDKYKIESDGDEVKKITLYDKGKVVSKDEEKIVVDLVKDEIYKLVVETNKPGDAFSIKTTAQKNRVVYPYDVVADTSVEANITPGNEAEINYTKRSGGTYIYSNNPELVPSSSVDTVFIETKNLSGEVFFTFEHANYTKEGFYLGYMLKNDGNSDVYITVTNIGYQVGGTWFGQKAWYNFYNTSFKLPEGYLNKAGGVADEYAGYDYAYSNYKPRNFQPTTYRLPAGEYMWVIGGTSKDAYNKINVDQTADKKVSMNQCTNGNVKFEVVGGSVTASFHCYRKPANLLKNPKVVGYRVGAYAAQYVGTANHSGVIDTNITWAFDDKTSGNLPVTYKTSYDVNAKKVTTPYTKYNNVEHTIHSKKWMTNLNPQNDPTAIGSDIVEFSCTDELGNEVVIDNYSSDGSGNPANTANWMIEYQEHYTFINKGENDRTVYLYKKDGGTLAILFRDSVTGEVLDTYYTIGQASKVGYSLKYPITVKANSTVQITLSYVLVACSYGNVTHWVDLK